MLLQLLLQLTTDSVAGAISATVALAAAGSGLLAAYADGCCRYSGLLSSAGCHCSCWLMRLAAGSSQLLLMLYLLELTVVAAAAASLRIFYNCYYCRDPPKPLYAIYSVLPRLT